jgi:hypothetical protein
MVSGLSRTSYRTKRKSASRALPIAIVIICLLVLIGGGIAVVALSGVFSKPVEKHPKKTLVTPTHSPVGAAEKEKEKMESSSVPRPQLKTLPPETPSGSGTTSIEKSAKDKPDSK